MSFCEPAKPDQYFYFIGFERKGNTKGEDFLDSAPSRPPPNGGGERTPSPNGEGQGWGCKEDTGNHRVNIEFHRGIIFTTWQ